MGVFAFESISPKDYKQPLRASDHRKRSNAEQSKSRISHFKYSLPPNPGKKIGIGEGMFDPESKIPSLNLC